MVNDIKSLLKLFVLLSICCFSSHVLADKENGVCKVPNPKSVDAVYNCITQSSINGINMFAQIDKMDCARIRGFYTSVLRSSWADAELVKTPPSCAVFAEVVTELTGKKPFWQGCMNYANSEAHVSSCFSGYLQATGIVNQQAMGQCQVALLFYESAVRSASDPVKNKKGLLPENYQKPSCDMINAALNSIDIQLAGAECLGFEKTDSATHVKQCLRPDFLSGKVRYQLDCNQMRQFYQTKLLRSYGRLPEGFSLLRCSVFTKVSDELVAEVKAQSEQKGQESAVPSAINEQAQPFEPSVRHGRRDQRKRSGSK